MYAGTKCNSSCVSCSHLSSLVLKPHLHHPNTESCLCSQRLPHLKPSRQKIFQHPTRKQNTSQHTEIFCPLNISFPAGTLPFWFALISGNVEWMQWSFWTTWLLPLQSLGPGAAPVLGPGLWRQFSYLSMTVFGAGGLRYTSLPQLTQNRMLLATSKLSSEVGETFLIWEFYLWNYCRARGRHLNLHYSKCRPGNIKKTITFSSLCCSRLLELCLTFLQGFEDTSKEALKARLCWVVRMVRGLLGLLGSFPSSPFPWPPMPFSGLMSNSSSSLFSAERVIFLYHQHKLEPTTPFWSLTVCW